MAKNLILSVLCVLTLSSFTIKESKKETVKATRYYYRCSDGTTGSFLCDCELPSAWIVAGQLCNKSFQPA